MQSPIRSGRSTTRQCLKHWLPAADLADPDRLRQARTTVAAQVALLVIASLLALKSLAQGDTPIGVGILAGLTLAPVLFYCLRRGWLVAAAHTMALEF